MTSPDPGPATTGDPASEPMSREQTLADMLSEFARTLGTDFPLLGILDHLIDRIVDVLPVTAAGVTLLESGSGPHLIAASSPQALRFEQLQTSTGEGPCVTAYETGTAVAVPDLGIGDSRFPDFCTEAAEAGLAAVFTFPLRHSHGHLGALDLYRDVPGELTPWDTAAAQTLADVTAAYLLHARAREEAVEHAETLRTATLHDSLTGLANRVLLEQRLQHAAERAARTLSPAAVLFVDLDRFKQVNDTHGHSAGDALLVAVAVRLSDLLRPGDTLARISGDEFVVLCEDLTSPHDVDQLVVRLEQAFTLPFRLALDPALEITITASIGMAVATGAGGIGPELVREADRAMYQAKRKGGGLHQRFDLHETGEGPERIALHRDLRTALEAGWLEVGYQPVVRTAGGQVAGVETLLRWTDPTRGPVAAAVAVTVAERTTLILDLGRWVLERACRDHAVWTATAPGLPALEVAVNVSVRQLLDPGFTAVVADVLQRTGLDPALLVLEMTEGIFLGGARAQTVLGDLKGLGLQLALDDFGTGYSSLSYLRRFPVDVVKIDREFVSDIGVRPAGSEIIAAVTGLAHALGMRVTAEGVETEGQARALAAIGCDQAQGFLYAAPMPLADLQLLLDAGPSRLPAGRG